METHLNRPLRPACLQGILALALAAAALFLSGCAATKQIKDPIIGPSYQVRNVYSKDPILPINVRRIALLPLNFKEASPALLSGRRSLEPLIHTELAKAARFEIVLVSPAELKQWTGRERWDAYEELPPRILQDIAQRTGAQAVLFADLSEYKAYPPIVIGWRMKLVTPAADQLWAVEEVFDSAEEPVANAARRYDRAQVRTNPVLEDSRSILLAPTRFGQYTLHALFETLPAR